MQTVRLALLPFSWIYGIIVSLRNWLYDVGIKKTTPIPGKSICIGNITVGGTGKSPLTAYLAKHFKTQNPVILSRGYGRKTKGLVIANETSSASEIGDEPMMYWTNFNYDIPVIVSEKRQIGIDYIRSNNSDSLILLDDAFQHRAVKSGLNIVLMTYDRPVFKDFVFPAGNLRETRAGLKRSDLILITKCPKTLTQADKDYFIRNLPLPANKIFFSSIQYGSLNGLFGAEWSRFDKLILVTGIAQPEPLYRFLSETHSIEAIQFADHHRFTYSDIQQIQQKVATFTDQRCAVVTTEKDAVRFAEWETEIRATKIPFFVQQITLKIEQEQAFNDLIDKYVARTNETSC